MGEPIDVGAKIRYWRSKRELTQTQLGERALDAEGRGLNKDTIKNIEKGHTDPGISTLARIAAALDVPITELVTPVTVSGLDERSATDNTEGDVTSPVTPSPENLTSELSNPVPTGADHAHVVESQSRVQQSVETVVLAALEDLCTDLLTWIATRRAHREQDRATGTAESGGPRNGGTPDR